MKKNYIITILFIFLFISCVSSKSTNYAPIPDNYKTIYLILDNNKTTISSSSYFSYSNNTATYIPGHSEDAMLNTVKNNILIQTTLKQKGYTFTTDASQADMILQGGYETNELFTDVILAFYDAKSNELLFTAEGRYGVGLDIQLDVNGALKKALEKVPLKTGQ